MSLQTEIVGEEVQTYVNNPNANSNMTQATSMWSRTLSSGLWNGWQGANWQIDVGCGSGNPIGFCMDGIWLSGPPPYDNWRLSKP